MEYTNASQLSSKMSHIRLYTHAIFIVFVITCQDIYKLVYYKKYHFSSIFDHGGISLLFSAVILLSMYFMAFVILRKRPYLNKNLAVLIKIAGVVGSFFLFIFLRWGVDQYLEDWLFGITNYPKTTLFSFFFHDNLVYAFMVILGGFFIKFMDDWYINDRIHSALEKQNLRLELDFLKSQVNPHFLFNTLNNIQSYIVQDEKMKSIELIGRLSEFMRFALYECNEEYIDLDKEINMLGDYIELERVRCDDRVNISFETSGNFDDYKIPPLLLIPFIENAFKHGADMQLNESWIKIIIKEHNAALHLVVENSFSALSLSEERSGGIGLQNVKKRLQYYFGNKQDLEVTTHGNVFAIDLKLQLI